MNQLKLMTKPLSTVLTLIGRIFFKAEWQQLSFALAQEYQKSLRTPEARAPRHVQHLLIFAEDRRFYSHFGVDPIGILRAAWRILTQGMVEGGSTIEQQLVRVLTKRYERTFQRKWREIILASRVCELIPKQHIPVLYLQIGYFGWRMKGFQNACERLGFDKSNLSHKEAASLIARLKYPEPQLPNVARERKINIRSRFILNLANQPHSISTLTNIEAVDPYASI